MLRPVGDEYSDLYVAHDVSPDGQRILLNTVRDMPLTLNRP